MHIHARSKAVQSAVAQSTVQPRPAFANSDLEQHARKASLSALAAPKQARTASLSTLTKTGACQTGHFDRTGGAQASSISLFEHTGGSGSGQSSHLVVSLLFDVLGADSPGRSPELLTGEMQPEPQTLLRKRRVRLHFME